MISPVAPAERAAPATVALWLTLFGNAHPVAIEIGPGRGEFLLTHARQHPDLNLLAIERSPARAHGLEHTVAAAGLPNARVIGGDAPCVIGLLPDASVAAFHIQFPDPWWKRRHHRRRLFTPALVTAMSRTLISGGTIELVTDVPDYFMRAQDLLTAEPTVELASAGLTAEASTTFARKAQQRGVPLYRSVHRRR